MNGWPETPESSIGRLLRRNVFESLIVVCRCRVGTVGRVEGRREGRKEGRKGESRERNERSIGVAYSGIARVLEGKHIYSND